MGAADILLPLAGALAGLNPYAGSAIRSGATVSLAMQRNKERQAEEEATAAQEAEQKARSQALAKQLMEMISGVDDPRANALKAALMGTDDPSRLLSPVMQLLEPPETPEPEMTLEDFDALVSGRRAGLSEFPGESENLYGKAGGVNVQRVVRGPEPPEPEGEEWSEPKQLTGTDGYGFYRYNRKGQIDLIWPRGMPPMESDANDRAVEVAESEEAVRALEGQIKAKEAALQQQQAGLARQGSMYAGRVTPEAVAAQAEVDALKGKLRVARLKHIRLVGAPEPEPVEDPLQEAPPGEWAPPPAAGGQTPWSGEIPKPAVSAAPAVAAPAPAAIGLRRFDRLGNPVP